jgi:hypothetical protein
VTNDQSHQRSEDVIEAASQLGFYLGHIAERGGHLEAREHLAQ